MHSPAIHRLVGELLRYPARAMHLILSTRQDSLSARPNVIVCPGGKMSLAMQLIVTPMVLQLMDRKRRAR